MGSLQECRIDLYKTHAKVRISIAVNHLIITSTYLISRRWKPYEHDHLCDIIPQIHPKFEGWVYVNEEEYYKLSENNEPSRLLLTGSVTEWHNTTYFNGQWIDLCNNINDSIMIEVDGQWIDENHLLNIVGDSPRLISVKRPHGANGICKVQLGYDCGYVIQNDTISTHDNGLYVKSFDITGRAMQKTKIDKMLLEWSIISE